MLEAQIGSILFLQSEFENTESSAAETQDNASLYAHI
jgi:hypothetical protein